MRCVWPRTFSSSMRVPSSSITGYWTLGSPSLAWASAGVSLSVGGTGFFATAVSCAKAGEHKAQIIAQAATRGRAAVMRPILGPALDVGVLEGALPLTGGHGTSRFAAGEGSPRGKPAAVRFRAGVTVTVRVNDHKLSGFTG